MKPKQTKLVLNDPVLKKKLKGLYQNVFIAAIEIILNNFVFTCGKQYIFKLLADVSPDKNINSTSRKTKQKKTQKSREELIETNVKYCEKSFLASTEQDKSLRIM